MLTSLDILFVLNVILSAIVAVVFTYVRPPHIDDDKRKLCFWLLLSVGLFVPLFGVFIAIWILFFSNYYYNREATLDIKTFSMQDILLEQSSAVAIYAPGWADVRLRMNIFPKKQRIQALTIANRNVDYAVNELNWMLLLDDVEELRLYAFSLLEKQRDYFNNNIYKLMQRYKVAKSPEQMALIEKQMAIEYWEMAFFDLVEHELRELILKKCYFYTEKAMKILAKDAELWCLLAHLHFANNQTQSAIAALKVAQQLKASNSRTLPFFAEYSFKNRDYAAVKQYLSADPSFLEIPNLGKIVNFWCNP